MSADSRYASIVERNVFGLKPPPPPPGPEDTKPPPSNITLTGIITLGGKRALMTTPPVGGKPGAPATPESYILKEGEIQGPIEVISIDEVNFVVKVRNSGQEQTLDFKNNGPKLVAGPPPAAAPGAAAGVKPMPGTMPGINPGGMVRPMPTQTPAGGVAVPMPNFDRNVRTTTPGTTGAGYPGAAVGTSLTGYGASGVNPHTTVNPVHNLTAEEQALMVEVERERTRDRVLSGRMPPLPPTPYTPAGSPGSITPGTTPGQGTQPGGQ
jgi:hypothetical protein